MPKSSEPRRELVTLADKYKPGKSQIAGWFLSEKLDGMRCFWDGGLTRGCDVYDVPWASLTHPKTGEPKKIAKPYSTGLWSRYGNPIMAPDWFLDTLPNHILDGELFAGRGNFQTMRKITAGNEGDDRWQNIRYHVYGFPSIDAVCQHGRVKNGQCNILILPNALEQAMKLLAPSHKRVNWTKADITFDAALTIGESILSDCEYALLHPQIRLPAGESAAREFAMQRYDELIAAGAEGVIVRDPNLPYEMRRTKALLKFKPVEDDEGELVGFTAGRGKYEGMIGALVIAWQGHRFELSGMTDDERVLVKGGGCVPPGIDLPGNVVAKHFTIGQQITFAFRELTDKGIPKEARYMRVRDEE